MKRRRINEIADMNKYCVICNVEHGPYLEKCCTQTSLVALTREGFFKKTNRYFALDGKELNENELSAMMEIERRNLERETAAAAESQLRSVSNTSSRGNVPALVEVLERLAVDGSSSLEVKRRREPKVSSSERLFNFVLVLVIRVGVGLAILAVLSYLKKIK